jgi:chaperone required for assembly of F1-ATPase
VEIIVRKFSSTHHQVSGVKRFYKHVDVVKVQDAYGITLDGRNLKTPAKNLLQFQSYFLAAAIAAEWDAQTNKLRGIQPNTMPLMSIASTTIDVISKKPNDARSTCLSFLPTDSLLFWTKEDDDLYKLQQDEFKPVIEWVESTFNFKVLVADGMTYRLDHSQDTFTRVNNIVDSLVSYQNESI